MVGVGDAEDNAAIVRIDVRSGTDATSHREQVQVFAMLRNFAAHPRDTYVTLTLEGSAEPVASRRLALPPGEGTPVVLTFEPRPEDHGLGLSVQLAPADAEPVDDVAFGRVPGSLRMPVVVATDAVYSWTTRAVEADPDVDLQRLSVAQLATVNVDPDALVIVEGGCPASLPGRDALVIAPAAGTCFGLPVGAPVEAPTLTSWESGDPRLRFLTLDGVHVVRSAALDAHGSGASLVRSSSTTLVADASVPGRTVTVVGFDPGASDWPLKASFVLFVRNVVELARLHRAQGAAGPARTGDPARVAVPAGVDPGDLRWSRRRRARPRREGRRRDPSSARPRRPLPRALAGAPRGVRARGGQPDERPGERRPPAPVQVAGGTGSTGAERAEHVADAHDEWISWLALLAALALTFDVYWTTRESRPRARRGAPMIPTVARLWMLAVAAAFVVAPIALAIALRRRRVLGVGGLAVALAGALPLLEQGLVVAGLLRETYVRFHHPMALLFVAAVGLFVGLRISRLSTRLAPTRRVALAVFSALAALAASLIVAEPELGRPLDRLAVVVAVDRSRSMDLVPGADARVRSELLVAEKSMHDDDRIGTVVFGAEAAVEDPPRPRSELAPAQRVEVGRDATDLGAAIRRALAELPADSAARVVLVTDGVETRGDALAAAAAAVAADVPVDVVVLEQKAVPDVRVVSVRAPPRADEGEPFDLRVVTSSAVATDVELRVRRRRRRGAHRSHPDRKGRGRPAPPRDRQRSRPASLRRRITALDPRADAAPEDNAGSAFVRVRGPALALVLEGDPGNGAPLRKALEAGGFRTVERSTTGVPADVGGLAGTISWSSATSAPAI